MEKDTVALKTNMVTEALELDPYGRAANDIYKFINTHENQLLCMVALYKNNFQDPLVFKHVLTIDGDNNVAKHENPEVVKLVLASIEKNIYSLEFDTPQHYETMCQLFAAMQLYREYTQKKKTKKNIDDLWKYIISTCELPTSMFAINIKFNDNNDSYDIRLAQWRTTLH